MACNVNIYHLKPAVGHKAQSSMALVCNLFVFILAGIYWTWRVIRPDVMLYLFFLFTREKNSDNVACKIELQLLFEVKHAKSVCSFNKKHGSKMRNYLSGWFECLQKSKLITFISE